MSLERVVALAASIDPDFGRRIEFLLELDELKRVIRRTWLVDGSRLENTAEHSWHLAMMAIVLQEHAAEAVDITRVVRMHLIHDLVEIHAR